MTIYHKINTYKGHFFLKEYETIKHHKNKIRYLREETVANAFKKGNVKIIVHFENNKKTIEIDIFSEPKTIKTYLGANFI